MEDTRPKNPAEVVGYHWRKIDRPKSSGFLQRFGATDLGPGDEITAEAAEAAAVERARLDGFEAGHREALQQVTSEWHARLDTLRQLLAEVDAARSSIRHALIDDFTAGLQLALNTLLEYELSSNPDALVALRDVIAKGLEGSEFELCLNAQAFESLPIDDLPAEVRAALVVDPTLAVGTFRGRSASVSYEITPAQDGATLLAWLNRELKATEAVDQDPQAQTVAGDPEIEGRTVVATQSTPVSREVDIQESEHSEVVAEGLKAGPTRPVATESADAAPDEGPSEDG